MSEKCPRCGQNREIDYHYKNDGKGWHTICKECREKVGYLGERFITDKFTGEKSFSQADGGL